MKLKRILYMALCAALLVSLLALPAMAAGINVDVQTSHEVVLGEELILYCGASSDTGAQLSYIWYETATGKLEDMYAINRGEETFKTYLCDTTQLGTRYYLCSVSDGTAAVYSDIITVRVISDSGNHPVIFTADSEPVVGGQMTVDIQKMTGYDSGIYNAVLEGQIGYEWYRDGQKVDNVTGTMKFTEADAGCFFHVLVKGYNITLKSEEFRIEKLIIPPEIETTRLPEATVGEKYAVRLKCYEDVDAEFSVYFNPGKANQFEQTGLTLKADGTISGKPAKAGEFTFAICAANEGGEDYATYTLVVKEPATDPTETTQPGSTPVVIAPAPEESKPAPGEDVSVIAPAPGDSTITVGASEPSGGSDFLVAVIVIVIVLAVLAAAAAAVIVIILVVRKRK